MELLTVLKELCDADNICGLNGALSVAEKYLKPIASVERFGSSLIATMGEENGEAVLFEAHIDEIGMLVTDINDGFLAVASAGGIDARMLSGMRVKIHGKELLNGVFCSVPPHLRKGESSAPSFDNLYIDTGLNEKAAEYIAIGDRVTFCSPFTQMQNTLVTSKALDNRAGVASLIRCAEILSEKPIKKKVVFLLSDLEETGGSGAMTAAFKINSKTAVSVDVSFGNQPDVSGQTGTLGKGAMIGVSPILSQEVTNSLKAVAQKNGIKYQMEIMGGKTSTDADHIALTREGVKTGLLSVPLRNMHTPVEVVDIEDIESVADILAGFVEG